MSYSDSGSDSVSDSDSDRSTHADDDDIVVEPDCYIYNGADDADTRLELLEAEEDEDDEDEDEDEEEDEVLMMDLDANAIDTPAATATAVMDQWLDDQLQASIFYEEPVHHITFHTMFVSDGGDLERIESRVVELAEPNVVGRFVIGNIVKRARLTAGGVVGYRLNSLFVYNAHVSLVQLAKYVRNPDAFSFVTALSSLNDVIIKPTLACFHSLNSVHIVLRRLPQIQHTTTQHTTTQHTTTQPTTTQPTTTQPTTTRVVSITRGALSSSARRFTRRRDIGTMS